MLEQSQGTQVEQDCQLLSSGRHQERASPPLDERGRCARGCRCAISALFPDFSANIPLSNIQILNFTFVAPTELVGFGSHTPTETPLIFKNI